MSHQTPPWIDYLWAACVWMKLLGPVLLLLGYAAIMRTKWSERKPLGEQGVPARIPLTGLLLTLVVSAAAALQIFLSVGYHRGPLLWDESTYVWKAYGISEGIRNCSPTEVWQAITREQIYPPIHGIILGTLFALCGSSQIVAVGLTAVLFVVAAGALYVAGTQLDQRGGALIGWAAVALFLGSRIHVEYAATTMLEMIGTLATLFAAIAYLRHIREGSEVSGALTGFAIVVVFFVKFNFGLFVIASVGLSQLSRRRWRPFERDNIWLWIPVACLARLWFSIPGKWEAFVGFANNKDSGIPISSVENFVFYPRAIAVQYCSSLATAVVVLLGVTYACAFIRRPDLRFFVLLASVGIGAMTIHHLKIERTIATVMPALWILAAWSFIHVSDRLKKPIRNCYLASVSILALVPTMWLYLSDVPRVGRREGPFWSAFPWSYPDLQNATELALAKIDDRVPTVLVGIQNEWSTDYLQWQFSMRHPNAMLVFDELPSEPRINFVALELLPGSPYFRELTPEKYKLERLTRLEQMESRLHGGAVTVKTFPNDRIRMIVVKDAELRQ